MKAVTRKIMISVLLLAFCLILSGCATHECTWCDKEFSGATYYAGIDSSAYDDIVCRECAQRYWAPLNVENFRR